MATPGSSRRPRGNKKQDSPQITSNLSGLKHQLHGTSYQVKLGIFVSLANIKMILDPTNKFSFSINAEDPTAGKFDDIVYDFQHGDITGTLKIQAKHKLSPIHTKRPVQDGTTTTTTEVQEQCNVEQSIPKITLNDCITDSKNDFYIQQYFKSFCDQQQTIKTSLEGYIICTNAELNGDAKALWYEIDTAALDDSTTSLDFYISSLFDKTGGKCYQFKINYKRAALVRLLINAIKSKEEMVTWQRPLFQEYRTAILDIIDKNSNSGNVTSFKLTNEFLDSTYSNSKPGYEAFRNEFKEQFQREFGFNENAWECFKKNIQINVAENFLLDEKNTYPSSDSFPEDNEEDSFKSFCDRFRFVCGTYNEQGLDHAIGNRIIICIIGCMKLKPISDKQKFVGSSFRVSANALKDSKLFKQIETESHIVAEVSDIQFGATLLSDVLDLQSTDHTTTLFLDHKDFIKDSETVKAVLRGVENQPRFVIICNGSFKTDPSVVQKWEKDILKDHAKLIFLIEKTRNIETNFSCFRICDLTLESWNQFLKKSNPLCTTTILMSKILQNNFQELPIPQVINLLDWGKQMEENNEISKKYHEIKCTYVHRPWIDLEKEIEAENIYWDYDSPILKSIKDPQHEGMNMNEITKSLKADPRFNKMFGEANNTEGNSEPIIGDESKKVLILLGEAGLGKSTNLTWLAWYLRKRNPSSWVVRCNLSDHCTTFKPFTPGPNNEARKVINETEAMKMLYKIICSSLKLKCEMAEICSNCLVFTDGLISVSGDLTKQHGLSLNNTIQLLVFKEKFNAAELVLLMDGFDEIAPYYKDTVLQFLYFFEQFKGVEKLYLTSRPYGFKEQFEKSLNNPSFFQLKPLSLQEKASMLYKKMKVSWPKGNICDEEISDIYKSLCSMILYSLDDLSNIPLNLMMSVDILGEHVMNENITSNIYSKTSNRKLLDTISDLSKPSFIVEEFVKVKIRHLLYDKNATDKSVADKPLEIAKFEKAIQETKKSHGQLAMQVIFNKWKLAEILSTDEMSQTEAYLKKILEGSEKTGIVHCTHNGEIDFIHRSFAEYLAAWWIIQRQIEGKEQGRKKWSSLESFWDEEREELRKNIDTILAKHHPLHQAVIRRDWETVESLLYDNPQALYDRDDGDRTPLHLIILCYDFEDDWPQFLPNSIESEVVNCKEKLFGWTALDYAFYRIASVFSRFRENYLRLTAYLLHHGASVNVETLFEQLKLISAMRLYEQVISDEKDKMTLAVDYTKHVMGYLSRAAIVYESHDACKKMKLFCDKVVIHVVNKTFLNFDCGCKYLTYKEETIIKDVIKKDSVWMIESIIQQTRDRVNCFETIKNSYLDVALKNNSISILKYFTVNDPSILNDDSLWECIVHLVIKNYKIEFKYFFDLYCSRFKIKDFEPWTIESDVRHYFVDRSASNVKRFVCDVITKTNWKKLEISMDIMIDKNLLKLLLICVATARLSMLRYLIKSSISIPWKAYQCLLDLASNINDAEANEMLRVAITSNLFDFSICLVQRYNIDFHSVDELEGCNVFHLCVSNKCSFWIKELAYGFGQDNYSRFKLFRSMLEKESDMNCFDTFDRKGRSILHLALENGLRFIVEFILARKLGISELYEIKYLGGDAIPNITFCYRAVREVSQSVGDNSSSHEMLHMLGKQIAKILLANRKELQELSSARLLLQEDAKELFEIAMKCRSLFLVYYLHREFPSVVPPMIYDANWLACTEKSLSPNFIDVTKWLLNPNRMKDHANLYEIVKKCDDVVTSERKCYLSLVNLVELVKQIEAKLSSNRSVENVGKLKLLALAVCLKQQSMIQHLYENLDVNIDWMVLIEIMEIVHHLYEYYVSDFYKLYNNDFHNLEPLYQYLFERTNHSEIDAEGRSVLHVAAQSGLGCMVWFLIENSVVDATTTNEQNGWNICHYYASRKTSWECCDTKNNNLLIFITKRVLGITSDDVNFECMAESRRNEIKELYFNHNEGRKSAIRVAVEAGNIRTAEHIILLCLGIVNIDKHKIKNSDQCSRFRECYDELSQIAAQMPFNAKYDYILHRLAKTIHRFSPENIEHLTEQEHVEDNILEDACRKAIKYRSLSVLEYLVVAYEDQMNQLMARCSVSELVACMIECIRRNQTRIFQKVVGHFCTVQGIQRTVKVVFGMKENDINDEATIDEYFIQWSTIDEYVQDVSMNRDYLHLFILSVAYGRLSMTRFFVEMLQLKVNKSLILLIMKALNYLLYKNCEVATPVYEYLANRCEGTPNLLHLSAQAGCWTMLEYLMNVKKLDPNETDSENGWNAGHYFVQASDANSENAFEVFDLLMQEGSLDCFGVYDHNGRSVLYLALENGHSQIVEYIIQHRFGISRYRPWGDGTNLEENINELQQILKSLPENIPQQKQQVTQELIDLLRYHNNALTQYKQLFTNTA